MIHTSGKCACVSCPRRTSTRTTAIYSIGTPGGTAMIVRNDTAPFSILVCEHEHSRFSASGKSSHEQGYPETQTFELTGPIADAMYRQSGDLSNKPGYDLNLARSISKFQVRPFSFRTGYRQVN
ncbi:hypothetical protein EV401DRAFT_598357 [Pisolithus croceorrhizus]|nr:hypothetical protein EV401DRAFT_598357 [Pisolithus croceorrhizus]